MNKKIILLVTALMITLGANAQFQEGKGYLGASLTGLDLHYNAADGLNIGLELKAGYFALDNFMLLGTLSAEHNGARYYIMQNGLYLGLNGKFIHANHNYNDLMPGIEIGYAFFINRSVTIEPSLYYDHSFKGSNYSTVGLKLGLGIYLFDD